MKQDQVKTSGSTTQSVEDQLKEKFQSIKSAETQPATRVVKLRYKSCCGCGCSTIEFERKVPFDSNLKDGDKADSMVKGDKQLREW